MGLIPRLMVNSIRLAYRLAGWRPTDETICAMGAKHPELQDYPVKMRDGRWLHLDLRNPVSIPYLLDCSFDCEEAETALVTEFVRPGDVAVDVGANIGWYCSLLCGLVGRSGRVHAFEPNQNLVRLLDRLCERYKPLRVHAAALGGREEMADFHIPANWISGSLARIEGECCQTQRTQVMRLDDFLARKGVERVDFVKLDAEGAEIHVLEGATATRDRPDAPAWLVEMSSRETQRFGYHPSALAEWFSTGAYEAYMVGQTERRLRPLEFPANDEFWFNALFVPKPRMERIPSGWIA